MNINQIQTQTQQAHNHLGWCEIHKLEEHQINSWAMAREFDLYLPESWEGMGVSDGYFLFDESHEVIGFLLVSLDSQAVAIEIKEAYRRQGLATALLRAANCDRPERDENPEFWGRVRQMS